VRDVLPLAPSRAGGLYWKGSRETAAVPALRSVGMSSSHRSCFTWLRRRDSSFCQLAPKEDGSRPGTCADIRSAGTFQPHLSLGSDLPEGLAGEETY